MNNQYEGEFIFGLKLLNSAYNLDIHPHMCTNLVEFYSCLSAS
jgi:hypothetical protein